MKATLLGTALTAIGLSTTALSTTAQAQSTGATTVGGETRLQPTYGALDPFYGDIGAFYGNLDPFYGDIGAFWGNLNPFYGDIGAFWGNLTPFYGDIGAFAGTAPNAGAIGRFWTGLGPTITETEKEWSALGPLSGNRSKYLALQSRLNALIGTSEGLWGAAVTARTGRSFRDGFATAMLAKHGLDIDDLASFEGMTAGARTRFFLDWYDGLMDFSGTDHVDYWMRTVNWTPAVTQMQGGGAGTIVGLLDGSVTGDADIIDNLIGSGGYANSLGGHGTGVASLIVAAHDGRGLMGIAPRASVVGYNPFDGTGTASWADVKTGILTLSRAGASVINMSLGVPGHTLHPEWNKLFSDPFVAAATSDSVFVLAAGNEGKAQTGNMAWSPIFDPNLIVVGSVGPTGVISSFSNTPGTTCLVKWGSCTDRDRLLQRFIVAPGELILVADGRGGFERRSGTSFAAPLVSGAITLLHDRWPWLAQHPEETVDIILRSATDLGSSGPDAVYGRGLLNVTASQSPLDFSKLTFYENRNGVITSRTASSIATGGVKSSWEADGVSFTMFETIGDTKRDFVVPMSSRLVGQKTTLGGSEEYFQAFIQSRFSDWIRTGRTGFSDVAHVSHVTRDGVQLQFSGNGAGGGEAGGVHTAVRIADAGGRFGLTTGYGQGGRALGAQGGFGLASDYQGSAGGVNPVLGFASGGAFASVDATLPGDLKLTAGVTQQRLVHSRLSGLPDAGRQALRGFDPYRADAVNVELSRALGPNLSISAAYTRLDEEAGLLGVQSVGDGDLRHGSVSQAATLGATALLGRGVTLGLSATAARTKAGADQNLQTTEGGVLSSAYAMSLTKVGLLGGRDRMRVSLSQPLHVERGTLRYRSVEVVDRATGEIGTVSRDFGIADASREHVAEMLYAAPVLNDGELSLFGRADLAGTGKAADYVLGGRLRIGF